MALIGEVVGSPGGQDASRVFWTVRLPGRDLRQRAVDLLVKCLALGFRPALFGVQNFQGPAHDVFSIREVPTVESLFRTRTSTSDERVSCIDMF